MIYTVTVEFRYNKIPDNELIGSYASRIHLIGIYKSIDEAQTSANVVLNELRPYFNFYNDKFDESYGLKTTLVTNCCTNDPVKVFIKINTFRFGELVNSAKEVISITNDYLNWKRNNDD